MFRTVISNQKNISDIIKFQYLRKALQGQACKTLKEIPFSVEGFKIACTVLEEEYKRAEMLPLQTIKNFYRNTNKVTYKKTGIRNARTLIQNTILWTEKKIKF
jgi:uncharacterized UBP type Zn finger protein